MTSNLSLYAQIQPLNHVISAVLSKMMGGQRCSSQHMSSDPQQLGKAMYTGQVMLYKRLQLAQYLHVMQTQG